MHLTSHKELQETVQQRQAPTMPMNVATPFKRTFNRKDKAMNLESDFSGN